MMKTHVSVSQAKDLRFPESTWAEISDGEFNHDELTADLKHRIQNVRCPEMDQILSPDVGTLSFWGG